MRLVDVDERRARLASRHHLGGAGATEVAGLAGALAGLHATDPATVMLAARARVPGLAPADVERALYADRTVVRMLGMRRTMFVVPLELMPVVQGACTDALVPGERRKVVKLVEAARLAADGAVWLAAAEAATLEALAACGGEATAAELGQTVPALARQVVVGAGTRHEARQGMATRVLFLLAAQGLIVRARPLGSWTSTLNRWAPTAGWLGDRAPAPLGPEEAAVALARRWLAAFGPGTVADLKWWTGWSASLLKRTLTVVRPVEVALADGRVGLVLADDAEPLAGAPEPWAALLPGLDPTVMGWFERDWFLGAHREQLFDRTGNAGPTIWWNGRVVGGWGQRRDGEIVHRLLEDVGADGRATIDAQLAALAVWVGPVRLTPRFRTPLERELTAT